MSTILPFDIIAQIIYTVGENKDTNLLKELALVSHCFHQICCKHLFATVELNSEAHSKHHVASSKKRFVNLLKSRPYIVNYIRKLTYGVGYKFDDRPPSSKFQSVYLMSDDYLLSPVLPNLLRTISRLNCLKIEASFLRWNEIEPSLTSAFLHLMHLPTVNHIGLSSIENFPISSLIPSFNLLRLDVTSLSCIDPLASETEIVVQSEMMPKLREFHIFFSAKVLMMMLHAKMHDGRPAFNFMNLKRLFVSLDDKQHLLTLLHNARLLEKLHLEVRCVLGSSFEGLHDILSASTRTLKFLCLEVLIYETYINEVSKPFEELCEGLEALAGHDMLEDLSFEIELTHDETEVAIGILIENVEKVLAKPGWSALRQVTFKIPVAEKADFVSLQYIYGGYLSHPSKLESVAFNFSGYVVNCQCDCNV